MYLKQLKTKVSEVQLSKSNILQHISTYKMEVDLVNQTVVITTTTGKIFIILLY